MKVKIFTSNSPEEIENQINAFLDNVIFVGIEFSTSQIQSSSTVYSAIVIYTIKK